MIGRIKWSRQERTDVASGADPKIFVRSELKFEIKIGSGSRFPGGSESVSVWQTPRSKALLKSNISFNV